MAITRSVIATLQTNGSSVLGTERLAYRFADESIISGSLLTVETNEFAILKSRGAILNAYETGQYVLETPAKPLVGSIVQSFFGGNSPWVFEVIYINRSKLLVKTKGIATSEEMAEMAYQVDYYVHVDSKEDALKLIQHLPMNGNKIDLGEIADYAGPAIEQSINQIVQVTKMENVNEKIMEIRDAVKTHLAEFLDGFGIRLNDLKVMIVPRDERMKEIISLQALGLDPREAVRFYLALKMAERGLISAPNAAVGQPFNIGGPAISAYDLLKPGGSIHDKSPAVQSQS